LRKREARAKRDPKKRREAPSNSKRQRRGLNVAQGKNDRRSFAALGADYKRTRAPEGRLKNNAKKFAKSFMKRTLAMTTFLTFLDDACGSFLRIFKYVELRVAFHATANPPRKTFRRKKSRHRVALGGNSGLQPPNHKPEKEAVVFIRGFFRESVFFFFSLLLFLF
jgi:hypothetical protein